MDEASPNFHVRVMWKAKSFNHEYWTLVNHLSKNPFVLSVEEILWTCQHLGQILLDLGLVNQEDIKVKRPNLSFLQRIAMLHRFILDAEGNWSKIQKILTKVMPVTGKGWFYANVRRQDWSILQTELLDATVTEQVIPIPKYRLIPENYRYVI